MLRKISLLAFGVFAFATMAITPANAQPAHTAHVLTPSQCCSCGKTC